MGRHKAGKPRRERPEPSEHAHEGFEVPDDYTDPGGRNVDYELLGQLTGAAFDGCTTCQEPLITQLAEDANTSARLVELACISIHEMFGGLPASLTEENVPGLASLEFRQLARAGLDGENEAMWRECAAMTPAQRREAVDSALDLMAGSL